MKRILIVGFILALLLAACAPSQSDQESEPFVIGAIPDKFDSTGYVITLIRSNLLSHNIIDIKRILPGISHGSHYRGLRIERVR